MSLHRSVGRTSDQRRNAIDPTIRLDLTQNPYGPCPAAIEAVETCLESPPDSLLATFRRRLGEVYRVPAESIHSSEVSMRGSPHRGSARRAARRLSALGHGEPRRGMLSGIRPGNDRARSGAAMRSSGRNSLRISLRTGWPSSTRRRTLWARFFRRRTSSACLALAHAWSSTSDLRSIPRSRSCRSLASSTTSS